MKSSKDTAHYRDHPNGLAQCAACTMWRPPSGCTAVEGDISPRGWCSYYESVAGALKKAERQVERSPSEAQKEAGTYAKGHLTAHGLPITIENPKGSKREGVDKGGTPWSVTMPAAYGYVKGTEGRDGDHVDVYLGPDHASQKVFVVDQVDAKTKRFDEHKALLSYPNKSAALSDYKAAFSDGKGAARIGGVKETTVAKFREWLGLGDTTKPAARQAFASGGRVDDRIAIARRIAEAYIKAGYTPTQAAAIAGNMAWEGGGRTDLVNPGDNWKNSPRSPHSIGIGQWNDRAPALIEYARQQGIDLPRGDYRDVNYMREVARRIPLETQVGFAIQEKSGPEGRANAMIKASEDDLGTAMKGAISYHRPAGWTWSAPERGHGFSGRMGIARSVLDDLNRNPTAPGTAVAEAPRSGGYQWPALSGSMAFGAPPPRAELPPPMAAGLRDVPRSMPAPTDVPRTDQSPKRLDPSPLPTREFDARSFFDTLDRNNYASGGKTMPLIKSGSKAAVSSNIKSELAAGKPRDQAIAIALDTARRYGKGRAMGGPVGYAEGGAPIPLSDMGPLPEQAWPDNPEGADRAIGRGVGAYFSGLGDDMRERSRKPITAQFMDMAKGLGDVGSNVASVGRALLPDMPDPAMEKERMLARPSGLASLGEFARQAPQDALPAVPFAGKAVMPATLGLATMGTLGNWFSPAEAAEQPKADPTETLRKSLEQLQAQREKQQAIADKAKERQDAARPKNRAPMEPTKDPRTGKITGDAKFFEAKREYDEAMAEARRLGTDIRDTEKQLSEVTKTQIDAAGGESLRKQLGEKSLLQSALPYAAPVLGGGLGYLGGMGMKSLTKFLDKSGVEAANKLLPGGGKAKPINQRIGSINDFWMKGGSDKPPFSEAGKAPWWKANQKEVAAPHDLYPPRSRALDWTANTGLTGVYAGEAALGYKWGDDAHQELKAAREAFNANKNEGNVQRLLKAERDVDIADAMLRMGLAGALAQGVKGSIGIAGTPSPRPNISKAETERADIRQALAASKAKAKAKAEKSGGPGSSKNQSSPPRSPNGAAHLLPLGLLPLAGSTGDLEPSPSPSLASSDSDIEPPYAKGGEVKKHWSFFQPRDKLRRFKGGPVYPKHTKDSPGIGKGHGSGTPEFNRGGIVSRALDIARRYASGGRVLVGPVVGKTGGREDALPVDVPAGSYVIPADCVSHLGSGNSLSGMEKLTKSFGKPGSRNHAAGGKVGIMISDGEFVVTPEQVAKVGGAGGMEQGHKVLDALVHRIRADHIKTLQSLPGPAKD